MKHLLVISSYPPKGTTHDRTVVGVAPYTKKAVEAIVDASKQHDEEVDITVLAEKIQDSRFKIQEIRDSEQTRMTNNYQENEITIKRIWKRGSLRTFFMLAKEILKNKHTKHVMLGFELSMFGGSLSLLLFPFFLLYLRFLRKDITLVLHHVVTDIREMSGHLNMEKKSLKARVLNSGFSIFYYLITHFCTKIIVFEEVLKKRLEKYGKTDLVTVIPLGVEQFSAVSRMDARKSLSIPPGQFVMVAFGFLAWYKGTDWLVDAYSQMIQDSIFKIQDLKLILAGGPNFQRLHFPFYKSYIEEIEKKCAEYGITITGFIEEKDIPLYFQAADLLLFPYRTLMSSSGPLTISYSFHTPFLFSKPLEPILQTDDLQDALQTESVNPSDIVFTDKKDFIEKITSMQKDPTLLRKLSAISEKIEKARSWKRIGEKYYSVIFETNNS